MIPPKCFYSDKILELIEKKSIIGNNKTTEHSRIIVSIGSGRAETEMESGELCICLDRDKKSLYACAFAAKYLWKKSANVVFYWYDIKEGISLLLSAIGLASKLPVVVLFQHPSPSKETKNRTILQSTFEECIKAMENKVVESIHFVYDTTSETKGTCWKKMHYLILSNQCVIKHTN